MSLSVLLRNDEYDDYNSYDGHISKVQYLRELRLEVSNQLVVNEKLPVELIDECVGFMRKPPTEDDWFY